MSYGVKGLLLAIASLLSTSGHAGIFELRGEVVADYISDECLADQPEWNSNFCFAEFKTVGDTGVLRFFADIGTRITDADDYGIPITPRPEHFFGEWQVNGVDGEFKGLPFSGSTYEPEIFHGTLTAFAGMDFHLGTIHGLSIHAITHDFAGGRTTIHLSDSSGTAFAGADLFTHAAVDDWLLNQFDMSLFDSGTWWVETFDGGAGAAGRFVVPEPSSMALLGIGLFLIGLAGRQRKRSSRLRV